MYEKNVKHDSAAGECGRTPQNVADADPINCSTSDNVVCCTKMAKLEKSIVLHKEALELLSE